MVFPSGTFAMLGLVCVPWVAKPRLYWSVRAGGSFGAGIVLYVLLLGSTADRSCHAILLAASESQVNVNWVLDDPGLLAACCLRRLVFSWPCKDADGRDAAFAIAVDIIPFSEGAEATMPEYGQLASLLDTIILSPLTFVCPTAVESCF